MSKQIPGHNETNSIWEFDQTLEVSLASPTLYLTATLGKGLVQCLPQSRSVPPDFGGSTLSV